MCGPPRGRLPFTDLIKFFGGAILVFSINWMNFFRSKLGGGETGGKLPSNWGRTVLPENFVISWSHFFYWGSCAPYYRFPSASGFAEICDENFYFPCERFIGLCG